MEPKSIHSRECGDYMCRSRPDKFNQVQPKYIRAARHYSIRHSISSPSLCPKYSAISVKVSRRDWHIPSKTQQSDLILLTPNPPPGCFQCSKRRIVCDAIEPSCNKCLKKGLECSGLGRFRFSAGIARRGRWKDCTIPAVDVSPELAFEKQQFTGRSGPLNIRWKDTNELVNRDRGKRKRVESAVVRDSGKRLRCLEDADRVDGRAEIRETDGIHDIRNVGEQDTLNRYTEGLDQSWDFDDIIQREGQLAVQESLHSIPPWIVPLSAQVRKHFSYCNVHPLRPLCYKRN